MAEQLTGVLREVVAADGGTERPRCRPTSVRGVRSTANGGDVSRDSGHVVSALPVPVVDPTTTAPPCWPARAAHRSLSSSTAPAGPGRCAPRQPVLRRGAAPAGPRVAASCTGGARRRRAELKSVMSRGLAADWYRDDRAARGHSPRLQPSSTRCSPVARRDRAQTRDRGQCRSTRRGDDAARYYETVWRTDRNYVSAAFGLARECARAGDRAGAITAMGQGSLPLQHISPAAAATAIEILLDEPTAENLDEQTLLKAGKRTAALTLESAAHQASDHSATGARRRIGLAAGGEQEHRRAAARCRIRRTRHPDRDRTVLSRSGTRDDRRVGAHRVGGEGKYHSTEDTGMTEALRRDRQRWPRPP